MHWFGSLVFLIVIYPGEIRANIKQEERLIRAGETLRLSCAADAGASSVHSRSWVPEWLVPDPVANSTRYQQVAPKFEIVNGNQVWYNEIIVDHLQPDDTGLYLCFGKDLKTETKASYVYDYSMFYVSNWSTTAYSEEINRRRLYAVYVYVSDGHSWLVSTKSSITVSKNNELILPCIATHPEIRIAINRVPDNTKIDYLKLKYDKALGFMKTHSDFTDSGFWKCTAKTNGKAVTSKLIMVNVLPATPSKMNNLEVYSSLGSNILQSDNFKVICELPVNYGERPLFVWKQENENNTILLENSETVYIPINKVDMKRHHLQRSTLQLARSKISITNATKTDAGIYKCCATLQRITKTESTIINIFDKPYLRIIKEPVYNDFYIDAEYGIIHVINVAANIGIDLDLTVDVDALSNPEFQWFKIGENTTILPDTDIPREEAVAKRDLYVRKNIFEIFNIDEDMAGLYKLIVSTRHITKTIFIQVNVSEPRAPEIYGSHEPDLINNGDDLVLFCNSSGMPKPEIQWFHAGILIANISTLRIPRVTTEKAGNYSCIASNVIGMSTKSWEVEIFDLYEASKRLYTPLVIALASFLIISLIFLVMKIRKVKKIKRVMDLSQRYLVPILNKNNEDSPGSHLGKHAYDAKKWEFPRDRLKLGKTLGRGAFGKVIQATAFDIDKSSTCRTVAVKMLKVGSRASEYKALMSELRILIHLGSNLNIVNLLGACTTKDGPLMIIVEYCKHGNLSSYLRRMRKHFVKHGNKRKSSADSDLEAEQNEEYEIAPSQGSITDSNEELGDELWSGYESHRASYMQNKTKSQYRHSSHETDDEESSFKEKVTLTTADLLSYSLQVARGMEFLASKECIHRDLAARNVLLAENQVVKICDFGLARDVYKDPDYVQNGEARLPLKWMAPESIFDKNYSSKSDVWSFGVLLWEIFSMGRSPYPGITIDQDFCHKLKRGVRMRKPEYAIDEIYSVMLACWVNEPVERPEFMKLAEEISDILQAEAEHEYLDIIKIFESSKVGDVPQRGVKPQPHPDEVFEECVTVEKESAKYIPHPQKSDFCGSSNTFSSTSDYKTMESDSNSADCSPLKMKTNVVMTTTADICSTRPPCSKNDFPSLHEFSVALDQANCDVPPSYSVVVAK